METVPLGHADDAAVDAASPLRPFSTHLLQKVSLRLDECVKMCIGAGRRHFVSETPTFWVLEEVILLLVSSRNRR